MFHPGELAVQDAAGVRHIAAGHTKLLWSSIPARVVPFVTAQSYCVLGGVSADGDAWAEFLVGTTGFATVTEDGASMTLSLSPGGLLHRQIDLSVGRQIGVLFVDLSTRKRLRVNGHIAALSGRGLTLTVDQSFPNCPKYIQSRRLTTTDGLTDPQIVEKGTVLPDYASNWIAAADTFFVASTAPNGAADVSHRGGKPGFVRTQGQTLHIPDYHGNSMFSTLGNFRLNPRAGLTFVDFETSRFLQLSGDVELNLDSKGAMPAADDTGRSWTFHVRQYVMSPLAPGISAEFINASPFNPAIVAVSTE
ncbi:hypothetical protein FHS89_002304 [Rubricella aquisinus]|uniref:Pyridoxamine 5'-phosphate oxidase n=1 Tax=Rubricella aquisinus TaxID=2028108 RepID=A0A840WMH1_9RHOB|nr:pyridoxamine 5'-phosphate oxidase family protein [Rubricella aquisinus]MBB5516278.1 hypothetical protein [Rubricella aquisinus]